MRVQRFKAWVRISCSLMWFFIFAQRLVWRSHKPQRGEPMLFITVSTIHSWDEMQNQWMTEMYVSLWITRFFSAVKLFCFRFLCFVVTASLPQRDDMTRQDWGDKFLKRCVSNKDKWEKEICRQGIFFNKKKKGRGRISGIFYQGRIYYSVLREAENPQCFIHMQT